MQHSCQQGCHLGSAFHAEVDAARAEPEPMVTRSTVNYATDAVNALVSGSLDWKGDRRSYRGAAISGA
jgi:hypothetical protein